MLGEVLSNLKLINKGAEADIFVTSWNGKKCVLKIRNKKSYRNEMLDIKIRTLRTIREAKMISEVRTFGVTTPLVYFVDQKKCKIYLQFISGKLVRDLTPELIISKCNEIGKIVAKLHLNGVMHGDLTTSNFISSGKHLVILDFGLAQKTDRIEDYAIDLRLFKEVLNSIHADIFDDAWNSFLRGYQYVSGKSLTERIVSHVLIIEKRGRYANVV